MASESNEYDGLRNLALHASPTDLGLKLPDDKTSVYGIVMDMGLSKGTATLVGYSTGDTSLYLSTGGGIIGGVGHAKVRQSARAWVETAQAHLASFSPTTTFEHPADGQARFFVLTNRGVLTAAESQDELNSNKLELSPVWYAAQTLLTDLRLSADTPPD